MGESSGIAEDLLVLAWLVVSLGICWLAGSGLASRLLKEPQSAERILRYRRQLLELTSRYHAELHTDLAGVPLDPEDEQYTRSSDQRVREVAADLQREESYRSKRETIAYVVAAAGWLVLNGLALGLP